TVFMRENVLWTVIAMTQAVLRRHQPFDDRIDRIGDFGTAFLNAAIERIDTQLHEYGAIVEAFDELRSASGDLVHAAEDAASVFAHGQIDFSGQELLFPYLRPAWRERRTTLREPCAAAAAARASPSLPARGRHDRGR